MEKDDRESELVVEPTVIAPGVLAGLKLHASADELPAATTYVIPASIELSIASSKTEVVPPPKLKLATDKPVAFAVTQSTPAITPLRVPSPLQSRTRTETKSTFFAIPHWLPPTVPATCVPCPSQSDPSPP